MQTRQTAIDATGRVPGGWYAAAERAAFAGVLLGVFSRAEETSRMSLGISSDATWVALAFLAGVAARGCTPARAAACGVLALTAANLSYYACVAAAEPGVDLSAVAGPPSVWIALGVAGGALFAAAGRLWVAAKGVPRVLASIPLAGVCVADGISVLAGGPLSGGVAVALGAALPVVSAPSARTRLLGAALSVGLIAIALTGRLESLLP